MTTTREDVQGAASRSSETKMTEDQQIGLFMGFCYLKRSTVFQLRLNYAHIVEQTLDCSTGYNICNQQWMKDLLSVYQHIQRLRHHSTGYHRIKTSHGK